MGVEELYKPVKGIKPNRKIMTCPCGGLYFGMLDHLMQNHIWVCDNCGSEKK